MVSTQEFTYGNDGHLKESTADSGWRMVYTFDGEFKFIIRTDEYVNDVLSQYHTFEYNASGTLKARIAWQDIPEEGGLVPVSKDVFEYDSRGNVIKNELFYF